MKSMTGFGKAATRGKDGAYAVEISTVNNRFLEFSFRMPRHLSALEAPVRELVQSKLSRGKISVHVSQDKAGADGQFQFNAAAAESYLKQLRAFKKKHKLAGDVTLAEALMFPDVSRQSQEEVSDAALWKQVKPALETALKNLSAMREREGKRLAADMARRLKFIGAELKKIDTAVGTSIKAYRDRLQTRLTTILESVELDKRRLEEEVAMLVERTDITEEITRLRSHLEQFAKDLTRTEPVGRRLNFLLQEMNREVNTIGSKSTDLSITKRVIALKEEIEKIREQVQNVE
ncbi:MAG TPA: YicC/YloC family endoribonuclease [candidate division Zixibacteria bacterium]|nr:YicC/YloC family endoribonuclease [candidate division Zixibacteria bacterium]